jgi:hypothetical protein
MVHRISGSIVTAITLFYGMFAIVTMKGVGPFLHAKFGIIVFSLIFFLALSGKYANEAQQQLLEN